MKMKKITAPSMNLAMERVKAELGSEAVILYSKQTQVSKFFGFIRKPQVEVVAAIDPETSQAAVTTKEFTQTHLKPKPGPKEHSIYTKRESLSKSGPLPSTVSEIYEKMIRAGIHTGYAEALCKPLIKLYYINDEQLSKEQIKDAVTAEINSHLESVDFGTEATNDAHIVNLVGPTGVGKTTTIAKLASKAVLEDGKTIAFITTDTYRIAAIDQLKTYAKILDVPVDVVYTYEEYERAVAQHKAKDLIFVDSAGRNYHKSQHIHDLKNIISFTEETTTYLVLSATSKYDDLTDIVKRFDDVPIDGFLFTKLDETRTIGEIYNLLVDHGQAIPYWTNGQNVPDDLVEAEREAFSRYLMEAIL